MLFGMMLVALLGSLLLTAPNSAQAAQKDKGITLTQLGRYEAGTCTPVCTRAEIAAYDPATKRVFAINANQARLDVLDITTPSQPVPAFAPVPLGSGILPNSVAIHEGVVAVALQQADPNKTSPGVVKFFDTDGNFLNQLTVGALPDMLVFSPNGRWLLVANEGEPNTYVPPRTLLTDPEGTVSIIDMRRGAAFLTQDDVRTATFDDSIPMTNASSIRIYGPGATLAQDLEPEYIAVSHDSKTAWVTLQENNAIAILDIEKAEFTRLVGLGFKDHSLPGNGLDASDQDLAVDNGPLKDGINIKNWPVFGMYEPDAIASYRVKGETYLVMANEGDTRQDWPGFMEEVRVGSGTYVLDPAVFSNAADLKLLANLGRLTVTNATGNTDNDNEFEKIFVPGARSFSIRRTDGSLVFDSGDQLEQKIAELRPDLFNSDGTAASFNTRSDNKGPEPEGVAIGKAFGRTYAFIGLERTGGIMVYDISDPHRPFFIDYANTSPTDISPEGILFISEEDSPNGKPLLVVSHEISNTTTIFEINKK
ncbi:MAG TPA: choice-of-anchor I family protein [Candidatus Binatia bacterium]|nr:choice-of-anchor I family protein [Candidatus Binatia bacterium]